MTLRRPLRVAVIGVGSMGAAYARILHEHPLAELALIVGRGRERLEAAGAAFPGVALSADGALPDAADLDAVIIATPEWAHLQPAAWALARGLSVLVEKPVADSLEDALAIAAAADAAGVTAMVCHSVRFDPRYVAARAAVQRGAIGAVRFMLARRDADTRAFARIDGRSDPAFWLAPHDIDIMTWIAGQPVTAVAARYLRGDGARPLGLDVELHFAGGITGRIETHWITPPQRSRPRNCFLDIKGERGAIEVNAFEQGLLVHHGDGSLEAPDTVYRHDLHGVTAGVDAALVDHFLRCTAAGAPPACTIADGVAAVRVAAAVSRAAAEGGLVAVDGP